MTDSTSPQPPPVKTEPASNKEIVLRFNPMVALGIVGGILALGFFLILVVAAVFIGYRSLSGNTTLSSTPATTMPASTSTAASPGVPIPAASNETDYQQWKSSLQLLGTQKPATSVTDTGEAPAGFWDRLWTLPGSGVAAGYLRQRLGPGLSLSSIKLLAWEKKDHGLELTHLVTLNSSTSLFLVPVLDDPALPKSSIDEKNLHKLLVLADDLPPGKFYQSGNSIPIAAANQPLSYRWTVHRAVKNLFTWDLLETDPLPVERNAAYELRLLQESGPAPAYVLRSEAERQLADGKRNMVLQSFNSRIAAINQQVGSFRETQMATLPSVRSAPVDRKSGSGSGTPTSMGIGTAAGAGLGAGIGAAAGGGDGAAIGAGAGAVAGLLGGYFAGREHEKREMSRANAARSEELAERNRLVRAIDVQVDAMRSQLLQQYAAELKVLADQQLLRLQQRAAARSLLR